MAADAAAGAVSSALLPEYDQEMQTTRKHLERVPDDKWGWGPHEKSMTMGKLASHLAEAVSWTPMMLTSEEMDFDSPEMQDYKPADYGSSAELLKAFDENVSKTREALASTSDDDWLKMWTMKKGEQVLMSLPRGAVVRMFLMSHNVHHRGQLSVYLRMCDISVPQTYGPSADEGGM